MICGSQPAALRIAVNPCVEHGDDLGQARDDGDFADAREQLAEREADAVLAALRLAVAATAQIRELSQIVALSMNSPSPSKNGKTSRSMFGPVVGSSRSDPQYSFVVRIDRNEVQRVFVVERISFIPVFYRDFPTKSLGKKLRSVAEHCVHFHRIR